ncbi:hypothetical protein RUM44_007824 [Polyplax serrata]|uniref:Uncharacterized protein n=1 Tax=Polyplax serrata TaxID=468196 RepID=A0ABR1B7B8_POLSC
MSDPSPSQAIFTVLIVSTLIFVFFRFCVGDDTFVGDVRRFTAGSHRPPRFSELRVPLGSISAGVKQDINLTNVSHPSAEQFLVSSTAHSSGNLSVQSKGTALFITVTTAASGRKNLTPASSQNPFRTFFRYRQKKEQHSGEGKHRE